MPSQNEIHYDALPQPRQLRIDSTTKCNAGCVSCHRFLSKRNGEMPIDLFLNILRDVGRWAVPLNEIVPVNYGEFFLRKDWGWILKMIEKHLPRTRIVIPTNGTLLNEENINELCGIQNIDIINFSINAYFDETYEAFVKLPASNLVNIRKAMEKIKVMRPDIVLWASMVNNPAYQTDYERDSFINHWKDIAQFQIIPAASADRGTEILKPVLLPCRSIFSDVVIGYDGKLSSCCFDSSFRIDLGKYTCNLLEDWKNPKFEELRKIHNEHKREQVEICRNCTFA